MTAFDLIDSIYARPHEGKLPGNERWITEAQLELLVKLIGENEEGSALKPGLNGGFAWTPSGRNKYVVSVKLPDRPGGRVSCKLMKMSNLMPSGMGMLFQ